MPNDERSVQFPVPWATMTVSVDASPELKETLGKTAELAHQHSHYPREIEDVLDDLERMAKDYETVGEYEDAGCTRDAARVIRVLYRKLQAK